MHQTMTAVPAPAAQDDTGTGAFALPALGVGTGCAYPGQHRPRPSETLACAIFTFAGVNRAHK